MRVCDDAVRVEKQPKEQTSSVSLQLELMAGDRTNGPGTLATSEALQSEGSLKRRVRGLFILL